MSTDCQPPAASPSAAIEVSPPFSKRRVDRIDEPARPLGAKRAALQLRRQSAPAVAEAKDQRTGTGGELWRRRTPWSRSPCA